MSIGENIKNQRLKFNLTQKDLANKLNVSYQTISKWENNMNEPDISMIRALCKIFNCSFDDLIGIDDDKNQEESKKEEEKITVKQEKIEIGKCKDCEKILFSGDSIHYLTRRSDGGVKEIVKICDDCFKYHETLNAQKNNLQKEYKEIKSIPVNKSDRVLIGICYDCEKSLYQGEKTYNIKIKSKDGHEQIENICYDCYKIRNGLNKNDQIIYSARESNNDDGNKNDNISDKPQKVMIGLCHDCEKPLYSGDIIHNIKVKSKEGKNEIANVCDNCFKCRNPLTKSKDNSNKNDLNKINNKDIKKEEVIVALDTPTKPKGTQIGFCQYCERKLYSGDNVHYVKRNINGKDEETVLVCDNCFKETHQTIDNQKNKRKLKANHNYSNSFITSLKERNDSKLIMWSLVAWFCSIVIALTICLCNFDIVGIGWTIGVPLIVGYIVIADVYCIFSGSYIGDIFLSVSSWSIRFPGIIFSFSLEGIKFLIMMKLLFWFLGVCISIITFLLALFLSTLFSIFSFIPLFIYNKSHY